jgi:Nucleotidyl transferase AbiEii toxin, Type IV TA system
MNTDILTAAASKLYPSLASFADTFYLAGGTGLALQIGHRVSVDFDLFSNAPIKKTLLKEVEARYQGLPQQVLVANRNELTLVISTVKFTFLHYPFPVILPLETSESIPMLTVKEILAGKAYTIGRRGEFKDYVDLYAGIKGGYSSIREIIVLAERKYGGAFRDRLFLEQLVYLDDVETVEIMMTSSEVPTKKELIEYFSSRIRQETLLS